MEQKIVAEAASVENVIAPATKSTSTEPDKKAKKMKIKKSVKMSEDALDHEHSDEPPVKTKKKSAKEAAPLCVKCATPKASAKKTKKIKKIKIELSFSQPKKTTNRVRRNLNEEPTVAAASIEETSAENNKSIEARKKKKIKKQVSKNKIRKMCNSANVESLSLQLESEQPVIEVTPAHEEQQANQDLQQESQSEQQHQASITADHMTFSNNRKSQRLSNITNNLTNYNRTTVANESSLLTNDDNASTNDDQDNPNITKDILNATFDKSSETANPVLAQDVSRNY